MRSGGADGDSGAEADFDLVVYNEDGKDYSKLYDLDTLSKIIDIFGNRLIGDDNLDGNITISDATLIQKYVAGLTAFSDLQKKLADVDGDGIVTIQDATCLQKFLAKYTTGTGNAGKHLH